MFSFNKTLLFGSKKSYLFLFLLFILDLFLVLGWIVLKQSSFELFSYFPQKKPYYEEIDSVLWSEMDFEDFSTYFVELSKEKGAGYAYQVLINVPAVDGVDMHLIGHLVGDQLYIQEGIDGMATCTHHLRNACSHSVVIGHFLAHGEDAIEDVVDACKIAPGGENAYMMCFHGVGHGVLAFYDYEYEPAVEICREFGTDAYGGNEYKECVGGIVMEMLSGIHNQKIWLEKRPQYLPDDDPLYLCSSNLTPDDAKPMCYVYLTPHIYAFVNNEGLKSDVEIFKDAFPLCDSIDSSEWRNREACFGGFGKEFVVVAQNKDIRRVDQMDEDQLKQVYSWCLLAGHDEGVEACVGYALRSIFWGGENDYHASISFCNVLDSEYKSGCFSGLMSSFQRFVLDTDTRKEFCRDLPPQYYAQCMNRVVTRLTSR